MFSFSVTNYIIIRKESIHALFPLGLECFVKMFDSNLIFQDDHLLGISYYRYESYPDIARQLHSMRFRNSMRGSSFNDYCVIEVPDTESFSSEWFDVKFGPDSDDKYTLFLKLKGTEDTEFESIIDEESPFF